jgi:purine/pyrimidine-nucleoside phosphorylase
MSDTSFSNVTVAAKANVYFDGLVVSHTVHFSDGMKKTLGLIYPGEFHFGTDAPERMEIIAGECSVVLDGSAEAVTFAAGSAFEVAGNSGFTITVAAGICEYICSFLPA